MPALPQPSPMSYFSNESKYRISSLNRKSVFLQEWWLIKVEPESKLGIGGIPNMIETLPSREKPLFGSASPVKSCNRIAPERGTQVFGSSPIAKRLDDNTLEAVNGVIITISGCINRSRTLTSGFSPEICDHFLSGFPYTWEECTTQSSSENCANLQKKIWEKCCNTKERSFPESFDDLPVTRVQDLLLSTTVKSESSAIKCIFRDILKQCTHDSFNQSASSVKSDENASMNSKEAEFDHKPDGEDDIKNSKETASDCIQPQGDFTLNETPKVTRMAQVNKSNTTTVSGHKRNRTSPRKQYQLRSARTRNNA